MPITQKELLEKEFKSEGVNLFGGLLNPGLYVLAGTSKVGKSMVATTMANCVAQGIDFFGKSMPKGKVIYFDNDNYDFETKNRIISLNLSGTNEILYEFNDSKSIYDINERLNQIVDMEKYKLIIIDSYVGLDEVISSNDSYYEVYPILKELRDIVVKKNLICILIHHTKKNKERIDQDNLIGSKALSGATTGTLLLSVRNEFDTHGELKLILRSNKSIIKIKKDEKNINWILDTDEYSITEEIPKNILLLINTVVSLEKHELVGTCQEIVQKTKMELNPNYLTKYLKQNKPYLDENHITFINDRNGQKRIIKIVYHENDKMTG
ncbi:AAA family ATPase [Longibaculum muris]|uniref:AAA family ATPase n=1 Tax=Longibaculum muris TaxID=1796628 RepID=UPI003AB7CBF8